MRCLHEMDTTDNVCTCLSDYMTSYPERQRYAPVLCVNVRNIRDDFDF